MVSRCIVALLLWFLFDVATPLLPGAFQLGAVSALEKILDIAGPLDMDIVLLRVVSPVLSQAGDAGVQIIIDEMTARMAEARDYLTTIAADLAGRGIRVRTRVRGGAPMTEILAAAREVSADLIAMTTHGRTGFSRLLFGSVAEAVLRQGEFSVFLMRQIAADAHVEAAREALR